jgi:CRISPR type I-E-associated protein CasB/Cse2
MVETEAKDNIDRARAFIEHLQLHSEPIDVMQLRRSVSVARKPATIPLVEEYLDSAGCKDPWERQVHYLVAGLWGTMVYLGRKTQPAQKPDDYRSLGHTAARRCLSNWSDRRIEYAFLDLLEADAKQMPHCLETLMIWLEGVPEIPIHWPELLADLLDWNQEGRPTQQKWARDFNRTMKEGDQRFQSLGKS